MPTKPTVKKEPAFDREKTHKIGEALAIVRKVARKKFDETIEVHIRLGVDPKKGEQQIRGTVVLPFSFGKSKIVAAFVTEAKAKEAKEAGADIVYTETDIPVLQKSGKIDFEIAIAIPDIMKALAPLARILGPKGLMPTPKNETITQNLKKTVEELKKGKIAFKNDDTANLHQAIGKLSLSDENIIANFTTFIDALKKLKPETSKGTFLRKITLCSTMGPGVKVNAK